VARLYPKPEPSIAVYSRLSLSTQERRLRLQDRLKCTMSELLRQALEALEEKLTEGKAV
jgi:hypothetical protein